MLHGLALDGQANFLLAGGATGDSAPMPGMPAPSSLRAAGAAGDGAIAAVSSLFGPLPPFQTTAAHTRVAEWPASSGALQGRNARLLAALETTPTLVEHVLPFDSHWLVIGAGSVDSRWRLQSFVAWRRY